MAVDRRRFLKLVGSGTGVLVAGSGSLDLASSFARSTGELRNRAPDVAVIGAGAFGGWTALYLRDMGYSVVLVDQYGPGNSRATSGDETRGIRTSYGENELWIRWAGEAISRWRVWDEEWGQTVKRPLFVTTSDLIMRSDWDEWMRMNVETWDRLGYEYEVLTADEIRYRWPQIDIEEVNVGTLEMEAGVCRARQSCETVASAFQGKGGELLITRASLGEQSNGRLVDIELSPGERLSAQTFVFACGPWLPKALPEVMTDRLRTPPGHVYYFGTPVADNRFTHPNLPSFNFPGVTGWPALSHDNRGMRVRTGGDVPSDPDTSERWIDPSHFERPRSFLAERFPEMADMPLLETRKCHYESSVDREFIIDQYPGLDNVWIAGGGSAEGFKFGPVVGQYVAERVVGEESDAELAERFRLKEETFEPMEAPA